MPRGKQWYTKKDLSVWPNRWPLSLSVHIALSLYFTLSICPSASCKTFLSVGLSISEWHYEEGTKRKCPLMPSGWHWSHRLASYDSLSVFPHGLFMVGAPPQRAFKHRDCSLCKIKTSAVSLGKNVGNCRCLTHPLFLNNRLIKTKKTSAIFNSL